MIWNESRSGQTQHPWARNSTAAWRTCNALLPSLWRVERPFDERGRRRIWFENDNFIVLRSDFWRKPTVLNLILDHDNDREVMFLCRGAFLDLGALLSPLLLVPGQFLCHEAFILGALHISSTLSPRPVPVPWSFHFGSTPNSSTLSPRPVPVPWSFHWFGSTPNSSTLSPQPVPVPTPCPARCKLRSLENLRLVSEKVG